MKLVRWPRSIFSTWDAANSSRRVLLGTVALVAVLAVALLFGAAPLTSAIARTASDVARGRLMLAIASERVADSQGMAHTSTPPRAGDLRDAVERVLSRYGVQARPAATPTSAGRFAVLVAQARFDALVGAVDTLAREEGAELVEATLTALVDPGAVRAELTFRR